MAATDSTRKKDERGHEFVTPADEAWDAFLDLFMRQRPRMMEIHNRYDLKPPPLGMAISKLDEPTPMGKLAEILCLDQSTITWVVDRLEERGLVERRNHPSDRRVRLVALTDEGLRIRDELRAELAVPPASIAALPAADQRKLRDILRRALDHDPDAQE
jgi:MarR family transcriptional regulator, organic hydroperoxide resistance regulator